MQRQGADPENMQAEDFLCDFCGNHWTEDRPLVEGHQGSCICGHCLTIAFTELTIAKVGEPPQPGERCILCREDGRDEPHWRSPVFDGEGEEAVVACRRCIKQSAGVLHKDRDLSWTKPGREPVGE